MGIKYGLKDVADVRFIDVNGRVVFESQTLKVSDKSVSTLKEEGDKNE